MTMPTDPSDVSDDTIRIELPRDQVQAIDRQMEALGRLAYFQTRPSVPTVASAAPAAASPPTAAPSPEPTPAPPAPPEPALSPARQAVAAQLAPPPEEKMDDSHYPPLLRAAPSRKQRRAEMFKAAAGDPLQPPPLPVAKDNDPANYTAVDWRACCVAALAVRSTTPRQIAEWVCTRLGRPKAQALALDENVGNALRFLAKRQLPVVRQYQHGKHDFYELTEHARRELAKAQA